MEGIDSLVNRRTERSPQKCTSEGEEKEMVVIQKKRKSGSVTKENAVTLMGLPVDHEDQACSPVELVLPG